MVSACVTVLIHTHAACRLTELMLGDVVHEDMSFQLDLGNGGHAAPSMAATTVGVSQPSLAHRRVNDLELDAIFAEYIQLEVFEAITAHYYHDAAAVSVFRCAFHNARVTYTQT